MLLIVGNGSCELSFVCQIIMCVLCTTQQHGEANKQKALPHKKSYFIAHLGPPTTSTIIVLHSSKARLFYFEKKHHFHACFLWDTQKIVVVVVEVAIFLSIYGSQARFCKRKIIDTDVSFWQKIQLWMYYKHKVVLEFWEKNHMVCSSYVM